MILKRRNISFDLIFYCILCNTPTIGIFHNIRMTIIFFKILFSLERIALPKKHGMLLCSSFN